MFDGRVRLDTKYNQLPDGSEIHTCEGVGEASQAEQDQLPVVSEMQAGERVDKAGEQESIGTKHDQLPDVSKMHAGEKVGKVGWLVCRLRVC